MAKSHKPAKIKWNKKGAALAYTLIATMVLMILSTSLFTAAGYNISLTTKNDNARQSYITCKSAVEYAKSYILQQSDIAKKLNTERENLYPKDDQTYAAATYNQIKKAMADFSIVRNSATNSGFEITNTVVEPDGKNTLAKCEVSLSSVTRITIQTVTASTPKSGGGFTVSAQNQTVTNKIKDTNKKWDESTNWDTGSTVPGAATAPVDSTTEVNNTEILLVRYVFTYKIQISAANQYSASDTRTQLLNYQTDCTIGSDTNGPLTPSPVQVTSQIAEIFAVGGQYGGVGNNGSLLNGDYSFAPNAASNMPAVFKKEIHATGSSNSISAPSVYFMSGSSLTVGDMNNPSSNGHSATITSNFVYFNGNIQGTKNSGGSWLKLYKRDINSVGIVQFNNTTILLRHPDNSLTTKTLNGLYYFNNDDSKNANNYTDLFDFSSFDSKLKQVPQADYAAISSIANQDDVNYLKSNIDNIVSGDSRSDDSISWLKNGDISDGIPSNQKGKIVYCYVNDCRNWRNTLGNHPNTPYAAKNIIFSWVGSSALTVPEDRTATFQADYIAMNTNQQAICAGSSSSRFIVRSNSTNNDPLTMVFPTDTVIQYVDSQGQKTTYTITAGTYSAVPSGLNLFSKEASDFFKNTKYGPFTGIGDKLADAAAPNFLLYGAKYGGQPWWVYNNVNTPGFIQNINGYGRSAYPVLFNQPMQISSGTQDRILSAPQVYFMDTGDSIYGNGGNANLYSNFIYYAGNDIESWNGNSLKLYGYPDASKRGIIYFANNCKIYDYRGYLTLTIPQGCYYFNKGIDLFNLNVQRNFWGTYYTNDLSTIDQAIVDKMKKDNYVDYIEKQHGNVISGDTTIGGNAPTNAGASWAPNGALGAAASGTFNEKDAYLYVNNAANWGTAAANYRASRINLQYVNADSLTVPGGKEVTFTADNLSLNGQKVDAAQASDKLVLQQGNTKSKFILNTMDGTGYVNVTLPHGLTVNISGGKPYTVPAGVYKVKSGTNLFDAPNSGSGTITPDKIQIAPITTFFKKGKYTNE